MPLKRSLQWILRNSFFKQQCKSGDGRLLWKGWGSQYFRICWPYNLCFSNSTQPCVLAWKQPRTIGKWANVPVFQQNFIYKEAVASWAGFGPQAGVYWALIYTLTVLRSPNVENEHVLVARRYKSFHKIWLGCSEFNRKWLLMKSIVTAKTCSLELSASRVQCLT